MKKKPIPTKEEDDTNQGAESPLRVASCSRSFGRVMWHLERIIHKINDAHEGDGYSPDALWLEEARHHIRRLESERDRLALSLHEHAELVRDIRFRAWPDDSEYALARFIATHNSSANVEHVHPLPAWAEGYYRVRACTTIKCRKHSGW